MTGEGGLSHMSTKVDKRCVGKSRFCVFVHFGKFHLKTWCNTQFFWEIGYRYELETFFKMFTRKKSRIISRFQVSTITLSVENNLVKIEDFQDFILFIGKSHTLLYTYVKNMMLYTVFLKDWLKIWTHIFF